MAQGSKNLSSMRSRRPQGGADDAPIPANVAGEPLNQQVQVPEAVIFDDGGSISGGVALLNDDAGAFGSRPLSATAGLGLNGYATGNHMYMWLHINGNALAGSQNIRVYGYSYALGSWGLLRLPTYDNDNNYTVGLKQCIIAVDEVDPESICVPIFGIDRVAFGYNDDPNGDNSDMISDIELRIAFNTF